MDRRISSANTQRTRLRCHSIVLFRDRLQIERLCFNLTNRWDVWARVLGSDPDTRLASSPSMALKVTIALITAIASVLDVTWLVMWIVSSQPTLTLR
jgi:hypothetical protein